MKDQIYSLFIIFKFVIFKLNAIKIRALCQCVLPVVFFSYSGAAKEQIV